MRRVAKVGLLVLLLVGLPLLGLVVIGQPLDRYLEFPPQTRYVQQPPFSWMVFSALALLIVVSVVPFTVRMATSRVTPHGNGRAVHTFPWWGWLGAALTAASWVLAWNRFTWLEPLQAFTFTPLWIGYILFVNAYTFKRTGRCMMLGRPRYFLWLFPLSAAFWWFFEYLNRFVQNWYYLGVQEFTPWEYVLHATVPFSTVLPAVLGTMELLSSYPRVGAGLDQLPPFRSTHVKMAGWVILVCASAGLIGIGIWPSYLFPLVWVAPLLVITSLQMVTGEETIFSRIPRGDWTALWSSALAALVCGVLWEMWNYKSLSHWQYAIPFVHRFQVFEMPLLGYAGYFPFGLECMAVAQFFFPESFQEMTLRPSQTRSWMRKEDYRMVRRIGCGLLVVGILLSAGHGRAQLEMDPSLVPKGFLSGKDWRGLSKGEQQAYAVGVIDGLDLAFAQGKQGIDLGWINACVTGMSSEQVRAMLNAEIDANPAELNQLTVHQAMYRALKKSCRKGPGKKLH
jgi:hypothetical protein